MPYQLSSDAMSGQLHSGSINHPSSSMVRGNIKSKFHSQTQAQWKDKLRRGCLERAKIARRERLRKSRLHGGDDDDGGQHGPSNGGSHNGHGYSTSAQRDGNNDKIRPPKRGHEKSHPEWNISELHNDRGIVDHTPLDNGCQAVLLNNGKNDTNHFHLDQHELKRMESGDSEENVVDTARSLVEQELQRALVGMQHCHQVCPLDGGIPWKKTHNGEERVVGDVDFMNSDMADSQEREEMKQMEGEYQISQEEFVDLLNDVTEELQREDELLEEELWEMERSEAMERERMMHQIDDYDCWEELQQQQQHHSQPNTYISPLANLNSPLVTCPVCNSSSLMESPHDGIKCTNANNCTFQLDIAHEGLTLNHLQNQLRAIYEEHSRACSRGILQFRVEKRVGMSMLMAKCNVCSSDVVVL